MKHVRFLMLSVLLMLLSACDNQPATPTPAIGPTQTPGVTATVEATQPTPGGPDITPTVSAGVTSMPLVPPTPTQPAIDTLAPDLEKMLNAGLRPTPVGSSDGMHIEGVRAFKLQGSKPLWVAHSYGSRSFEPEEKHYVSIYEHENERWHSLASIPLESTDYVDRAGVTQVQIEPKNMWLQVDGGAGAHSGVFDLLRFDGTTLSLEQENFSSSPGAGEVRDVNGDGTPDLVLNGTDDFVFCYACGVRLINFTVLRWDGTKMAGVELSPLATSAPEEAQRLNDLAIKETKGDLWKAAKENIEKAKALAPQDETLVWNAALIGLTADARAAHTKETGHPLLAMVFYGDYDAAIASIREYSPEELFRPQSPLIVGTPAEGDEETLRQRIIETTTKAIEADPNLAGAYFLRGWARFKAGADSPEATADIVRASELAPNEELFKFAAAYMQDK
ncbi:MAG TPA: hypothetical protein VJ183_19555 [Chloroflexia bacterium]|nr:hypothetical protein [Chloroflexia bacterium]